MRISNDLCMKKYGPNSEIFRTNNVFSDVYYLHELFHAWNLLVHLICGAQAVRPGSNICQLDVPIRPTRVTPNISLPANAAAYPRVVQLS